MKLLFAIKSLNVAGGGAERVLAQIASALCGKGHDVTIITFDGPGTPFYALPDAVRRIDLAIGTPGESMPRFDLVRAVPLLRSAVRDARPDVVVGFMHSMYIPLGIALLGTRYPFIASEHIGIEHYRSRPVERALLNLTPLLSVRSTIPSERVRAGFPLRLRRRMVVMHNPVAFSEAADDQAHSKTQNPVVLAVGRLADQKNHAELIASFSRVSKDFPSWRLRIVGEGELRDALQSQVEELGRLATVSLPGVVQDVQSEYAGASIVAVPSKYESFGLVTAEALSAGRPVVGFADCPGTNELVVDGFNGLLVPGDGDRVAAFAAALRRLMSDAELRRKLSAAGPASVAQFELGAIVDRWELLLQAGVRQR